MSRLREIALQVIDGIIPLSTDELAAERMKLCEECSQFKKLLRQCDLCGCFLDMKVKVLNAQCPIQKW